MKVLVATGIEKLNEDLLKMLQANNIENSGQCFHRSVLQKVINETGANTLVISPALSGDNDLVSIIRSIRKKGTRVIVLPGSPSLPQTLDLVKALVPYGIYDFVYDKVKPQDVIDRLKNPGNLGDVAKAFNEASIDLKDINIDNPDSEKINKPARSIEENEVSTGEVDNGTYSVQNETGADPGQDICENYKKSAIARQVGNITGILTNFKKINVSIPSFRFTIAKTKRQYSRVITVISPVSAGKTFITVNLSAYLAQLGYSVAVVDADFKQLSIANWLSVKGNGLYEALENIENCLDYALQPSLLPGLFVFTAANDVKQVPNIKALDLLLKELELIVDVILVDTSQEPPVSLVMESSLVIMVTDMDINHLQQIQKYLHNQNMLNGNSSLLINKAINKNQIVQEDIEDMLFLPVSGLISCKPQEVCESIKEGIPACMFVPEIKEDFERFWKGVIRRS